MLSSAVNVPHFHCVLLNVNYTEFCRSQINKNIFAVSIVFGRQEGHPACKKRVVGCWRGYLSGARCRLAYGPADATATHCLLLQ